MSNKYIELLIDQEQNFLPSVTRLIDNVSWKFSIRKTEETGMYLEIECKPVKTIMYWECNEIFEIVITNSETAEHTYLERSKFSNYNSVETFSGLEDNVKKISLNIQDLKVQVFEFTKEALFDKPVENLTDFKFHVEGQPLYVCKKILANHSKFMCKWFDDECSQTEKVITKTSCNSFRVFLGLLHHQNNLLTLDNVETIVKLASDFEAAQCVEECKNFVNVNQYAASAKILKIRSYMIYDGVNYGNRNKFTSFAKKLPKLTDIVLFVGDKKFHVSKQLLAYHSSYFYTMFYSDFVEKGKDEIELKEIDADDFELFLKFIYHPNRAIEVKNIEAIWQLLQMYDAQLMIQKFIDSLQGDKQMNDIKRIITALDLNIPKLFDHVISKHDFNDLSRLFEMDGFNDLDDSTVGHITRLLFEKKKKSNEDETGNANANLLSYEAW